MPDQSPIVGSEMLTRACGCEQAFPHYHLDEMREDRRQKFMKTPCIQCGKAATRLMQHPPIPAGILEDLNLYGAMHQDPGDFLQAVLANDLSAAVGRADHKNVGILADIVTHVHNHLPRRCYGSWEVVRGWLKVRAEVDAVKASER
jgi:hypothetical protein